MSREPLGLYLLRFLMSLAVLALLGLLYWSNLLMEENLIEVRNNVDKLDSQFERVLSEMQKAPRSFAKGEISSQTSLVERIHIDKKLPNLLQEDPYYKEVLPKLLPDGFRSQGERRLAALGKPEDLHPFSNWAQASSYYQMCVPSLATNFIGNYSKMAPDLAIKIEERIGENGAPEFWIHLRENVFWEPLDPNQFPKEMHLAEFFTERHPVTAHDFKFWHDVLFNPYNQEAKAVALRTYYKDIESFRVIDDLTFVVKWKAKEESNPQDEKVFKVKFEAKQLTGGLRPLPRFVYQYFADGTKIVEDDSDPDTYLTHSVWAQNFAEHWAKNIIVSCGPWTFEKMTDKEIRLEKNPNYFNPYAVLVQSYVQKFKDSPEGIWQAFKSGEFDYISLIPSLEAEWDKFRQSPQYEDMKKLGKGVEEISYIDRIYAYIGWNQKRLLFEEAAVRKALTMAVDRKRIIEYNLNDKGVELTGPFFPFSPAYDNEVAAWPYDPKLAKRILEKAGWYDSDGDGILEKEIEGKRVPFRFHLTYAVKNTTAKPIVEYISKALREIGIDCQLRGAEIADLTQAFEDRDFDAIYLGWSLGTPPENPRQLWHSSGAHEKGSSNFISFENKEADEIIDALDYAYDPQERQQLYHRFHHIIHEESPYTFIYTPKSTLLYRDYVKNVFIPTDRPDLTPDADIAEPDMSLTWLEESE